MSANRINELDDQQPDVIVLIPKGLSQSDDPIVDSNNKQETQTKSAAGPPSPIRDNIFQGISPPFINPQKDQTAEKLLSSDLKAPSKYGSVDFTPRNLAKQVSVLTYNIFLRPPPIKNNKDDYKNERTKIFLNSLNDFDIVCFQELFGFLNQRKHKIIFNAMKQGFYYHASSPSPSFFSSYLVDGGLVTISRYPIIEKKFQSFKYGVLSDNLSQKGVLYTKIQVNDAYIHQFNTHLQASYVGAENNIRATVITRIDQLLLMRQFIEKQIAQHRESETDLVLICGDFNVNAREHSYPMHFLNEVPLIKAKMEEIHPTKFTEYDILKTILSADGRIGFTDALRTKFGESPITYADTYVDPETRQEVPLEEALTIKEDLLQKSCLDYIIQLHIPMGQSHVAATDDEEAQVGMSANQQFKKILLNEKKNHFRLDTELISIDKFLVMNQPFTQLSDHYGVSAQLKYVSYNDSRSKSIDKQIRQELKNSASLNSQI